MEGRDPRVDGYIASLPDGQVQPAQQVRNQVHAADPEVKGDGTIVAWGDNHWGQAAVPTGLRGVVSIAAGYGHSLVLVAR
jgi:hypothetical protein